MITLTATARCHRCGWASAGDWADVDRQAERHTKRTKHPTGVTATPGRTRP